MAGYYCWGMAMQAVIVTGGKQYRVKEGLVLRVEKLEKAVGEALVLDQVLMVSADNDIRIGAPYVAGAKVTAEVISHGRAKKIHILKFRRRKHSMKHMGHRQWFTELKITGIAA